MVDCKWLPDCFDYPDWNNYKEYEDRLYELFRVQIIDGIFYFRSKTVQIRWYPVIDGKEECFFHCTCKDYNSVKDRQPDPERMIRIPWIRPLIDNYTCSDTCCEEKPLAWRKPYKNKRTRYYLYFNNYLLYIK